MNPHRSWLTIAQQQLAIRSLWGLWVLILALCSSYSYARPAPDVNQDNFSTVSQFRFKTLENSKIDLVGGQWATVQDKQGFIWFGGAGGVARYDGYDIKLYRHIPEDKTSLSNNYVTDLLIDRDGDLWVATLWGLNRYDVATDQFTRYEHSENDSNSLSHNWVWNIWEDPSGALWLATDGGGLEKFDKRTQTFTHHRHEEGNEQSVASDFLLAVFQDSHGLIWIGSKEHGVDTFDPKTQTFQHFAPNPDDPDSLSHGKVNVIYEDRHGNIWVGTDVGLNKFNASQKSFTRYLFDANDDTSISNNLVRSVSEDKEGYLWIATDGGGLNIYNPAGDNFYRHMKETGKLGGPTNNKIRSIFADNDGGLWFGHFPAGITQLDRYASAFKNYQHNAFDAFSLSNSDVLSVAEDAQGNIWVGTEKGLNYVDRTNDRVTRYLHDPRNPESLPADPVTSLIDHTDSLWAGTWGGGLGVLDKKTGHFKVYKHNPNDPTGLRDSVVRVLMKDRRGVIWLGAGHGLSRYHAESDTFEHFVHDPKNPQSILKLGVNALYEDSRGDFWVGGDSGLHRMDRKKGTFERFVHDDADESTISAGYISAIGEDANGDIWVATGANGLNRFNRKTKTFSHYTAKKGLADDRVGGIITDSRGFIWFGTGRGLSRFDIQTEVFQNYTREHGLPGNIYKRPTCLRTRNGEIVFGSTKGLTIFDPTDIAENMAIPPVVITDFHLFNKPVDIFSETSPINKVISQVDEFTLTYKQSVFSFQFASLNYIMPERNQYAYKLEGFDEDWVQAGQRRATTYTNLDAGNYIFKVRGSNNEGVWNEGGTQVAIHILPPPWKTWWAYTLYILAIIAALALFVRSQQQKVREAEAKMEMERAVVQRLEHLDKLKDDFLANTSHELRTPLNGIIGLAESLIDGAAGDISDHMKSNLNMISISGRRLAHLVNDILDFSKLKNKNIRINSQPIDLYQVADVVITLSRPSALSKHLTIENNIPDNMPAVEADDDRLQQIFYNLIGNSVKFTEEGKISVDATVDGDWVWVNIRDTGIGIPEDMLDKIFDSFEQVEDHENRSQGGTGLGLTVTKQIVELHHGQIKVESTPGKGSVFSFSLPKSDKPAVKNLTTADSSLGEISKCVEFENQENAASAAPSGQAPSHAATDGSHEVAERRARTLQQDEDEVLKDNSRFKIMVVDDDAINRQVLLNQLRMKNYTIETAASGQQALDLLQEKGPFDLILLDIMMPGMSGYEVCARIRVDYSIQELPIIFLTAKNLIVDLADGFQLGANDFLTKPISIGEISSRVRTHLELLDINRNLESKVKQRTEEVTMANRELQTLDSIVATIHQELRFDRLLQVILNEAMTLFPAADYAAYWKFDKVDNQFKLLSSHVVSNSSDENEMKGIETLSPESLRERYIVKNNEITDHIYILDMDRIGAIEIQTSDITGAKSALAMSMILEDEVIGVLVLSSKHSEDTFVSSQPSTLERFRSHVISALSKSNLVDLLESHCNELENISVTDQLTGLRNRRYLYNRIDSDIANLLDTHQKIRESGEDYGEHSRLDYIFLILDIDHFKAMNDTHGHVAGDKILSDMGMIIRTAFRESDYCIRWGGEEFLIVARYSSRDSAPAMAEKLRSMVEEHRFTLSDDVIVHNTCSIGFACFPFLRSQPEAFNWEQVLDVADSCLYAAKKSQRNAWVGVDVNDNATDTELVVKFLDNPEPLVENGDVRVLTNLPKDMNIVWK